MTKHVDVVFDGPPGPTAGRFVEVEDDVGRSIRLGEWIQRPDGYWVIRIKMPASISVVNGSVMTNAIAGGSCEQRGVFRRL